MGQGKELMTVGIRTEMRSDMSPRFWVVHEGSMAGLFMSWWVASYVCSAPSNMGWHWLYVSIFPTHHHFYAIFWCIFVIFLQCFYHPGTFTVTGSSNNSHVCIIVGSCRIIISNKVICQIWNMRASDWLKKGVQFGNSCTLFFRRTMHGHQISIWSNQLSLVHR